MTAEEKNMVVDDLRRQRLVEINANRTDRAGLEARHGRVWDTNELSATFDVIGFASPYVVVRRRADGMRGSLEFQHSPRFYFNFQED